MSEDDRKNNPSGPSPQGVHGLLDSDDDYSASTVVGEASPELLALLRGSGKSPAEVPPEAESSPTIVMEMSTLLEASGGLPAVTAIVPAAREPLAAAPAAAPRAPLTTAASSPPSRTAQPAHTREETAAGLPPVVSILFFFALASLVLAAVAR